MNVIDAYQKLMEFFNEEQVFNLKEHRIKLVPITVTEEKDEAAILCALKEMEKAGLIRTTTVNENSYWVLFKSIQSYPQTVEISAMTCAAIASVLNEICEKLGNESEKCDPSSVSEKDIKNLIYVASKVDPEVLKK